jgi:predicted nucleic acid-binding Zn ribbon protein
LSEALQQFLRTSGLADKAKHRRIQQVWQRTVGSEIAGQTRILSLRGGVLEVSVESSALLNDLRFHTEALLHDLRNEIKRPHVSRVSFLLDSQVQGDGHE